MAHTDCISSLFSHRSVSFTWIALLSSSLSCLSSFLSCLLCVISFIYIYICAYIDIFHIFSFRPFFLAFFSCPVAPCSAARRPLGALSFLPFHSSVLSSLPSLSLSRGTLQRRSTPARRSERRSAPARFPLGALSFLSFHHSTLSFWPSLWLSRSTLQRRSAPARRPKLPSFPFFRPFFLAFSFAVPWHAAAPLGARSTP